MGAAVAPLMAISTGLQVVGGIQQTRAEMRASSYQQAVALRNQQIAEENARLASLASQEEGYDQDIIARDEIGQHRVDAAASGLEFAGSLSAQAAYLNDLARRDQIRIRLAGINEVRSAQQQASDLGEEARMAGQRRRSARTAGFLNIGSTLIGGALGYRRYQAGM